MLINGTGPIKRNATAMTIFQSYSDQRPLLSLSSQMFPHSGNVLEKAMKLVSKNAEKHKKYLFLNCENGFFSEDLRIYSNIFEKHVWFLVLPKA